MDFLFAKPTHIPGFVTVAVNQTSDPLDPLARGGLRALCPEETRHALVFAIKRDIDQNRPVDKWRRVLLSTPVQFQAVDDVDMVWVATGLREKVGALYETVYYSNVQRVFQIMALRQRQERLTGKRTAVSEVCVVRRGGQQGLCRLVDVRLGIRPEDPPAAQPCRRGGFF